MLRTMIGRLRLTALLEGVSLLILVLVAVPLKYIWDIPEVSTYLGPVHGALFVLYVLLTLQVAIEERWKIHPTIWQVIIASFIPFGTFYVDRKYFIPVESAQKEAQQSST